MSDKYETVHRGQSKEHLDMLIASEQDERRKESYRLLQKILPAMDEWLDDVRSRDVYNKVKVEAVGMTVVDLMITAVVNTMTKESQADGLRVFARIICASLHGVADDVEAGNIKDPPKN